MPRADLSSRQLQDGSDVSPRRLFGVYYTPDDLASVLVRWALADKPGPVLDPSFGGCAFLEAAVQVLSEMNVSKAGTRVYGVDIDSSCANTARSSKGLVEANCFQGDFLAALPRELPGSPYAAIVGNPPYVRHHWIRGDQLESARAVAADSAIQLPATASLWAYFLLHALRFLSPGGRLAMLVPEAILQTDYGAPLRQTLADSFSRSLLVYVRDRIFAGTDEAVVAVACSGFGKQGDIMTLAVESVEDLRLVLNNPDSNGCQLSYRFPATSSETGAAAVSLLSRLGEKPAVRPLGEVADVRVGVVTGANHHFIRSAADLDALGLPAAVRHRVVPRTRWLKGLEFTDEDHDAFLHAGAAALLVRPQGADEDRLVEPWIQEGLEVGVEGRHKCAVRKEWFRVDMPSPPDGFATCARAGSPLLVLNRGECRNSNAVHSLTWKNDLAVTPEAVAVGFLTSAVSAWAELRGRRYGGGVLKIEPGTLKRIPVPLVEGSEDVFRELNDLIRQGEEEKARSAADQRVLRNGLGLGNHEIEVLRRTRTKLMKWRRPSRGGNGHG